MAGTGRPFICVRCRAFTAELHCFNAACDWLVCLACESVIRDSDHRMIATRDRFLRELANSRADQP